MKEDEELEVDWNVDIGNTEALMMIGKPGFLEYDFELTDKEISIWDFLPGSVINTDVKLEELTPSAALEFEGDAKLEKAEKTEPCGAAQLIEANIPTPEPFQLSKWRTFISAASYHPNILAHGDVACLKELFHLLGSSVEFESVNVMIDLGKTVQDYKPVPNLCSPQPSRGKSSVFNFAHVKDFFVDTDFQVCIVKKYAINDLMKKAVSDMVDFIIDFPEALYLEIYDFILDFLLKFGVDSEVVIDAVMRTQRRRRKCQCPASVLVLKKANSLGKGRKEFLQLRLLESPEQKYRPIVPLVEEPTPVRILRNRRTGCVDDSRTPISEQFLHTTSSTQNPHLSAAMNNGMVPHRLPTNSDGLVFAVKRKLFFDDETTANSTTVKNNNVARPLPVFPSGQYNVKHKGKIMRSKKRFYKRRDSNSIEKPFACNICPNRSFAYKGNLVLHMKKKHLSSATGKARTKRQENVVPAFSCPVCLQGYASKYRCKAHVERLHPEVMDWDPICNIDSVRRVNNKTTHVQTKKKGRNFKRFSRKSAAPLSEKQISSLEHKKPSQMRSSSNSYANARHSFNKKEVNPIQISKGREISITFDPLRYSNLNFNHIRTRQQFRAAVVK